MKQRINLWWKALLGAIFSLLGFSGCEAIQNIVDPPCEYGMPHANYKLLGDVKDSKGNPVKGIRVVFAPYGQGEDRWENDTLYTDDKGHFEREKANYMFGWPDDTISFVAEDVDGEENGSFQSAVVGKDGITITKVKDGDGNWYQGDFEISTQISLKEKSED